MNQAKLSNNVPLFYLYSFLNSFILDRGIWMLFLRAEGFSLSEIALIESAYHCMVFLFEVPTGYIADRYGKRASLVLAEAAGILSACLLLWSSSALAIVIGFMLGGLVGTFRSGAASAMIYDTMLGLGKEASFKRYNSHLSAVVLVTMGISGAAGGALSGIGWAWVYLGKAVLHALTLAVVLLLVEPAADPSVDRAGERLGSGAASRSFFGQLSVGFSFMKSNVSFLALSLFGAILYSMSWSITFYSQVIFQSVGLSNKIIGVLNGLETWVSAGIAAAAFAGERWVGKRGSILIAGFGFIVSLSAFSVQSGPAQAIIAFLMMSVFISYIEPLLEAYLNELLPSSIRATMLSVFSMLISTGMMITFSVIGFLADRSNLSAALTYVLFVWIPVCSAVIVWSVRRNK